MNPVLIPVLLMVAGTAGATLLMDPASGQRRRALVRDRIGGLTNRLKDRTRDVSKDISSRTQRFASQAKSRWRDEVQTDEAVCRRVRAAIREAIPHQRLIGVSVTNGHVLLHGEVLTHEREPLLSAVRSVPGVTEVTDRLTERESIRNGEDVWGDAMKASSWKRHVDLRQERWTPPARIVTGILGGALIGQAARRPSALGVLAGVVGSTLLARSAMNKPLTRLGRGQGVVDVHRNLVIHAPVERVFALFDSVENYPCFLRSVREVRRQENGRSHWVVRGPAGSTVEWDSITTVRQPNELLAWHSVPGSKAGQHSGVIRFERLDDNQTRVDLRMSYSPPAGAMGHAVLKLLGADSELDEDLAQLKRVAESWDSWRNSVESSGFAMGESAQRVGRMRRTMTSGPEASAQGSS
jgi:uncharacterized membrane protein